MNPVVGVIMGSESDLSIMQYASAILIHFDIQHELTIVSAHRTPLRMVEYAMRAEERGLKVIIAGAGGAAHLPGMVASLTDLPVIGVPIKSTNSLDGLDSILSILQMPDGVPTATVALNGGKNAGIIAAKILALSDKIIDKKVKEYRKSLEDGVLNKVAKLKETYPNYFDDNKNAIG